MNPAHSSPLPAKRRSKFPVRLIREISRPAQIKTLLVAGLIVCGLVSAVSTGVWFTQPEGFDFWAVCAFCAVFGLVGMLLLAMAIHQTLAVRVPETIVELENAEILPGKPMKICVSQSGPVSLHSLKAGIVCLERFPLRGSDSATGSSEDFGERLIFSQNFLDTGRLQIAEGTKWETTVEFLLSTDLPEPGRIAGSTVQWKIEVWGRVRMWPDFMHPFPVCVRQNRKNG